MNDKLTVIFYDEDRKTILDKQEVEAGENVSYQGKIPEKPAENGIEYIFVGWETKGRLVNIEENVELFARYEDSSKLSKAMMELSEQNAEAANLNEVMRAGQKVNEAEKATRNLSIEQKKELVAEVKDKGSVNLDKEVENERD